MSKHFHFKIAVQVIGISVYTEGMLSLYRYLKMKMFTREK
jgi:hypothetical protein